MKSHGWDNSQDSQLKQVSIRAREISAALTVRLFRQFSSLTNESICSVRRGLPHLTPPPPRLPPPSSPPPSSSQELKKMYNKGINAIPKSVAKEVRSINPVAKEGRWKGGHLRSM